MVTKYTTGDRVLIPATITSAEILDGEVRYSTKEFERIVSEELKRGGEIFIAESKIEGYAKAEKKKAAGGRQCESWWQRWRKRQKKTEPDGRSPFSLLFCLIANLTDAKR